MGSNLAPIMFTCVVIGILVGCLVSTLYRWYSTRHEDVIPTPREPLDTEDLDEAMVVLANYWKDLRLQLADVVEHLHEDLQQVTNHQRGYIDLVKKLHGIEEEMGHIDHNWRRRIRAGWEVFTYDPIDR